jgi:hypothetical protein
MFLRALLLVLLCLHPGCTGGPDKSDARDDTSGSDTGSAIDDTSDSGGKGNVAELRFSTAPYGTWRVGAWLGHVVGDELELSSEAFSRAVTGQVMEVELPEPDSAWQGDLWSGSTGAAFSWFAYEDTNGDGDRDGAEPMFAASTRLLILSRHGAWGAGETDSTARSGLPVSRPLEDGFDLHVFPERTPLVLSGTVALSIADPANARFGTINFIEYLLGGSVAGRPIDTVLPDPYSFTFTDDLDALRITLTPISSMEIGIEGPMAYEDTDGTGDFTAGDVQVGNICAGDQPVVLVYVPPILSVESANEMMSLGFALGWNGVRADPDSWDPTATPPLVWELLPHADFLTTLASDTACGPIPFG